MCTGNGMDHAPAWLLGLVATERLALEGRRGQIIMQGMQSERLLC